MRPARSSRSAQSGRSGRRRRIGPIVTLVATLIGVSAVGSGGAVARAVDDPVTMAVLDVSPSTPTIATTKPEPVTIRLSLTNTTGSALAGVTVTGVRGAPFANQQALDAAMTSPQAPSQGVPITSKHPVTIDLPAGASRTVAFTTTTSIAQDAGICICTRAGAYPLYFAASAGGTLLGAVQTYLPAFFAKPEPIRVSWVWPLLERPHRLLSDTVFFDDDLASAVAGGRLDRALQTLEDVQSQTNELPITVLIDPELLDELQVMATGHYQVQVPGKAAVAGTGAQPASAWLARLRAFLSADPAAQLALTPAADPDVEQATQARLPWTARLTAAMQARIGTALGTTVPDDRIAWPVSGAVHAGTLTSIASGGVSTVLLDQAAFRPGALPADGSGLAVTTRRGAVQAFTIADDVASPVDDAVSVGGTGTGALPDLLAELAVRVAEDPSAAHTIVLAPSRAVDAVPDIAARVIAETTKPFWTRPVTLATASVADGQATTRVLAAPTATSPRLPDAVVSAAKPVVDAQSTLASLLGSKNVLVTELPVAVQRLESAAWIQDTTTAQSLMGQLQDLVTKTELGVFIVRPSSGTYTLASDNSSLPLTIENDLDYPVYVVVHVATLNGLPGFHADDVVQRVDPHGRTPLRDIRATFERSGRIQVQAVLKTRSGAVIGTPVDLSVRTTALGRIGIIITVVSGAVLVLALLRRVWQRYRRRGEPPSVPDESIVAGVA